MYNIDECCLLPSQVFIPQLQFIPSQSVITSPILPHLSTPINVSNVQRHFSSCSDVIWLYQLSINCKLNLQYLN